MPALKQLYLRTLEWIVVLSVLAVLALISGNVFLRYVLNSGIFLSEGISGLLCAWMIFVGAILVLYDREHIGVDMLVRRLPLQLRRLCFVVTHVIMIYATWLLLEGSWTQAVINLHVISPATQLPIAALYAAGVVFAAASGVFLLSELALMLSGRLADRDLVVSAGEDESEAERVAASLQRQSDLESARAS